MTNTLNTLVEALEYAYPLRVLRYEVRRGSGGGRRREIELLCDAEASLLTERRRLPPYGMEGGEPSSPGENMLIRDGQERRLPGTGSITLKKGGIPGIRTPGCGCYGGPETD